MTSTRHDTHPEGRESIPSILTGIIPGQIASPSTISHFTDNVSYAIFEATDKPNLNDAEASLALTTFRRGAYAVALAFNDGTSKLPPLDIPLSSDFSFVVDGMLGGYKKLAKVLADNPNPTIQRMTQDARLHPKLDEVLHDPIKMADMLFHAQSVGNILGRSVDKDGLTRPIIEDGGMQAMTLLRLLVVENGGILISSKLDTELQSIADAYDQATAALFN